MSGSAKAAAAAATGTGAPPPVRAVLSDLDGCLLAGDRPAPGAEALVRALGDRLAVVSNNSSDTPATLSARLTAMGLPVPPARILLAGAVAVELLARERPGARVALFAAQPIRAYAEALGLRPTRERPEVALLARDPRFTYDDLARLVGLAHGGTEVIVTNLDGAHPGPAGRPAPETGALLAALRAAVPGLRFRAAGKPEPELFRRGLAVLGARAEETAFLGDNPATDGAGAARAGLRFVLVGPPEGLLAPGVQALRAVSAAARRPAAHPA